VTGSQPVTALNPLVPHPGFDPDVTSLRALGWAYYQISRETSTARGSENGSKLTRVGFMKPTGPFLREIRASLIRAIMAARVGADVPT
jgi:hypothetical protein